MRDFDIDRAAREDNDRTFRIGGQEFTFRPYVHPNTMVRFQASFGQGDEHFLAELDKIISTELLEPGQEEEWLKLRAEDHPKPPSAFDLVEVYNYVMGEATGRPTERSSDSTGTSSPTGTASRGNSRSKALTSVA